MHPVSLGPSSSCFLFYLDALLFHFFRHPMRQFEAGDSSDPKETHVHSKISIVVGRTI